MRPAESNPSKRPLSEPDKTALSRIGGLSEPGGAGPLAPGSLTGLADGNPSKRLTRLIGAVMEFLYAHAPESRLRAKVQIRLRDWAWRWERRC